MADIDWEVFDVVFPPLPPDFDYGAQHFTGGRDLQVLLRVARSRAVISILELYTARGDTSLALARACPQARVSTVDIVLDLGIEKPTGEVPDRHGVGAAFRGLPEAQRIRQIVKDPRSISWDSLGEQDVVFVDGDHSYEGVASDTEVALHVVRDNGVIVWDDYWSPCPGVMHFVDDMNRRSNELVLVRGTRVVFSLMTPERRAAQSAHVRRLMEVHGIRSMLRKPA